MPDRFTQPSYYLASARDLRERAKHDSNEHRRRTYLFMAQEYEEYAADLEKRSGPNAVRS